MVQLLNNKSLHMNIQGSNFQRCETCIPSISGLSETAAYPPSPIADDPSALPSPTSSVSRSSGLFTQCRPLCASSCAVLLYISRYCTVRFKMFSFFFFKLFVGKVLQTNNNTALYSQLCQLGTEANFVGPMNKLDLQTQSQNRTCINGTYCTYDENPSPFAFTLYL